MRTRRYLVAGRVQGVCFRASACTEAQALRLDGWVRNLPDGRVEVLARGEKASLAKFEAWLTEGPPRAQVTQVIVHDSNEEPGGGFVVC